MQIAPLPPEEPFRIECLHRLNQLDTPAEDRFDRLTRLAQRHFQVAGVMVTLVDNERQWFKSTRGTLTVETPREISFCAHTILAQAPLVVPDLTADPRFEHNPVVADTLRLRFYAGVPVHSPEGLPVGTFCLVDIAPRQFGAEEMRALQDFAACAEGELHRQQLTESESEILAQLDQMRRRSCIDEITRAWTEALILDIFHREFLRAQRQQQPLGLVRLALKNAQEAELREAAETVRRCLRPYDSLGRLGGAEFLIVAPGAGHTPSLALAQRIQASLESAGLPANFGVCAGPLKGSAEMLQAAQQALEAGTNPIVEAAPGSECARAIRVHSLGGFEVHREGNLIPAKDWKTSKTKYLLAYLLGEKHLSAPEELVLEAFWPKGGEAARHSLRVSLSVLRILFRPFCPDEACWRESERVFLHPQLELWSDIEDFSQAFNEGWRLSQAGHVQQAIEELQRLALHYRGPYMEGYYADWALQRRARYEEMFCDSTHLLAQLLSERGQHREALQYIERVLEISPERQDSIAISFRCQLALGRADAVVSRYKKLASLMRREYATEPSIELVELHQRAKMGLTS